MLVHTFMSDNTYTDMRLRSVYDKCMQLLFSLVRADTNAGKQLSSTGKIVSSQNSTPARCIFLS
jgi:hypothetical protein